MLRILAAALALAATTSLLAQTPPQDTGKGPGRAQRMHDCSKAPDPKACEERREKMRQAMKDAHKACEGKEGPARRDCMREQMCAHAKDPAQCQARAKERAEHRQKAMEACKGKQGEEMKHCMREQRRGQRGAAGGSEGGQKRSAGAPLSS